MNFNNDIWRYNISSFLPLEDITYSRVAKAEQSLMRTDEALIDAIRNDRMYQFNELMVAGINTGMVLKELDVYKPRMIIASLMDKLQGVGNIKMNSDEDVIYILDFVSKIPKKSFIMEDNIKRLIRQNMNSLYSLGNLDMVISLRDFIPASDYKKLITYHISSELSMIPYFDDRLRKYFTNMLREMPEELRNLLYLTPNINQVSRYIPRDFVSIVTSALNDQSSRAILQSLYYTSKYY
ncbi:hypothetical protein D3C87_1047940 [compost metagenome]